MARKARLYNWNDLPTEVVRKGVSRAGFVRMIAAAIRGDDLRRVAATDRIPADGWGD